MRRAVFTLTIDVTEEYFEKQLMNVGNMLESGEFHKKLIAGIENQLTVIDAKLEVTHKQETNE